MTECYECSEEIRDEHTPVVSGKGVWCTRECWEAYHDQPWPDVEGDNV